MGSDGSGDWRDEGPLKVDTGNIMKQTIFFHRFLNDFGIAAEFGHFAGDKCRQKNFCAGTDKLFR